MTMIEEDDENVEQYIQKEKVLSQPKQHTCRFCGKSFDKAQGLVLHTVRMHTHKEESERGMRKALRAKARAGRIDKMNRLIRQREYNRVYRERTKAAERKEIPRWKTPEHRRKQYEKTRNRYYAQGLNARGRPLQKGSEPKSKSKHYVWPILAPETNTTITMGIKFCPHCGVNIEKYL